MIAAKKKKRLRTEVPSGESPANGRSKKLCPDLPGGMAEGGNEMAKERMVGEKQMDAVRREVGHALDGWTASFKMRLTPNNKHRSGDWTYFSPEGDYDSVISVARQDHKLCLCYCS